MLRIYSDLPQPVINALLEHGGFELAPEHNADVIILSKNLPPAPYKLGSLLDYISAQTNIITLSGIEFNLSSNSASMAEKLVKLTEKECAIIKALHHAAAPQNREELLKNIWNYAADATTNTVETHIYRLRQKINGKFWNWRY